MDKEALIAAGYRLKNWNGGAMPEYWKSFGENADDSEFTVCVRFNEWEGTPFIVYVKLPRVLLPLPHMKTIVDMDALVCLLKGQPEPAELVKDCE